MSGDDDQPFEADAQKFFGTNEKASAIDEVARLKFAGRILFASFVMAAAVFVTYVWLEKSEAIKHIFELVKVGLLPLATLVVSFYFTKTNS